MTAAVLPLFGRSMGTAVPVGGLIPSINRDEEVAMTVIPIGATEQLSGALGEAVVKIWSSLPHSVQHALFEEAVTSRGEAIRPPLAVFLHERHPRTAASFITRCVMEPDSLGG